MSALELYLTLPFWCIKLCPWIPYRYSKPTIVLENRFLTLQDPSKVTSGGSESVIDISLDAGLKEVVLVEDNLHGLLEAKKAV